jgi:hypothetical protein
MKASCKQNIDSDTIGIGIGILKREGRGEKTGVNVKYLWNSYEKGRSL